MAKGTVEVEITQEDLDQKQRQIDAVQARVGELASFRQEALNSRTVILGFEAALAEALQRAMVAEKRNSELEASARNAVANEQASQKHVDAARKLSEALKVLIS